MKQSKATFIAIGGIMCALAVAIMFLGSVVPFATYAIPALSSLCIVFLVVEFGRGLALLAYTAISILSLLLVPEKEIALLFAFFFGFYPLLKSIFEQHLGRVVCLLVKLAVFNVSIVGLYFVVTRIFIVKSILDDFAGFTSWMLAGLLALGNVVFVIFDIALSRLVSTYLTKYRERIAARK